MMGEGKMPSLPASMQLGVSVNNFIFSDSDMFETNYNNQLYRSTSSSTISSFNNQNNIETKNYRNRTNSKVKLLVRSHAMKESTSPPCESQNDLVSSTQNHLLLDNITTNNVTSTVSTITNKKFVYGISLTSNINNENKQQTLNNNEPIYNSNLSVMCQSPKKMKNLRTSRIALRTDSSSSFQAHYKNSISSINNNKSESQKSQKNNSNTSPKCNNCVKNDQNDRFILFQTSISPSTNQNLQKNIQKNEKNEERRSNVLNVCNNEDSIECGNTVFNNRSNFRYKLRHQNPSSQNSYECASPVLSRDNSIELYTDGTGIDLEQFITDTINRNQKDQTVLLKIEKDLLDFVKDRQKISHKFPNMSSYNRMLVHRVAAYFGMEHNVDQSGLSVIVTRTKNMRIPDTRFKERIRDDLLLVEEPRRSILKRDSNSFEDSFNFKSPDRTSSEYCRRSKSFEEREEEYERARRRIFKENSENDEVTSWPYWSSSESSETSMKYRLLHPSNHSIRQTRLAKGESLDAKHPIRSNILRPSISKSYSFGGYTKGMLSRDSSVMSTNSTGRHLIKQESSTSMCSHLTPSSSGYKSRSQRSETTISSSLSPSPVPSIPCNQLQISSQDLVIPEPNSQTVIWVISSISNVPPGSIIINPQTNQPYTNQDGSLYRFDSNNPPKLFMKKMGTPDLNALKLCEPSESYRTIFNNKNDCNKRQESQIMKHNFNSCFNATTITTMTTTMTTTTATNTTHLTSSVTPPNLTFKSSTLLPQPSFLFCQHQRQSKLHSELQLQQPQSQSAVQQQQALIRAVTIQSCNHSQAVQPYATYTPMSEPYSQNIYQHNVTKQTVMMNPHPLHGLPFVLRNEQEDIYNQNQLYANYTLPMQHSSIPQSANISELSNYFMAMNHYDQRGAGDSQITLSHPHTQLMPGINETLTNVQPMQSDYWQTSTNQILPQQTRYFAHPLENIISLNQNQNDRQISEQRFISNYSINLQTMPTISQSNVNYMNNYTVPYKSIVTPNSSEYLCQPPIHVVPAYYLGQSVIHPSSVIYRVSTLPNIQNSNQLIRGVYTLTPANEYSTPVHELYGIASGNRSTNHVKFSTANVLRSSHHTSTFQLFKDMRLIHPGVSTNARFQYTLVQSSSINQNCCSASYRPIFYLSNTFYNRVFTFLDGKNQKLHKQRFKKINEFETIQLNLHQSPLLSFSANTLKHIEEG